MHKTYFHNQKLSSENKHKKEIVYSPHIKQKINVDINKLLNRIKVEKKKENKKQLIFYSSVISVLFVLAYTIF